MTNCSHSFEEEYQGPVGFGFDRATDEATVKVYLQKFSHDALLEAIVPRLSEVELEEMFDHLSRLLANHLSRQEYEELFLK